MTSDFPKIAGVLESFNAREFSDGLSYHKNECFSRDRRE